MEDDRSWLKSRHLTRSPEGVRARAEIETLAQPAVQAILSGGDDLARISVTLAHRYFVAAVALQGARPGRFRWWAGMISHAASLENGGRTLAQALLELDAIALSKLSPATAGAWSSGIERLSDRSPRLAAAFARGLGQALTELPVVERTHEKLPRLWAEALERVAREGAWRGELLATHLAESAPRLLPILDQPAIDAWADVIVRVGTAGKNPRPPNYPEAGLRCPRSLQQPLLRVARQAADTEPRLAEALLKHLAEATSALSESAAVSLIAAVTDVTPSQELAGALALLPAVVHDADVQETEISLAHAVRIATVLPDAIPSFLRSMGRALDEGGRAGFEAWLALGLELARTNPSAGLAHFRLETRTAHKVLADHTAAVTFEELEGVVQRYLRMISGRSMHAIAAPGLWLLPPIDSGQHGSVRLPERVELFRTAEDNQSFLLLSATHAAARWLYGTFDFDRREYRARRLPEDGLDEVDEDSGLSGFLESFPNPLLAVGLFTLIDGIRLESRLLREFPGLQAEYLRLGSAYATGTEHQTGERLGEDLIEALFLLSVARVPIGSLPSRLHRYSESLAGILERLRNPGAEVYDSAATTARLYWGLVYANARGTDLDSDFAGVLQFGGATAIDPLEHLESGASPAQPTGGGPTPAVAGPDDPIAQELKLELSGETEPDSSAGVPLSPDELRALIESGVDLQISQGPDAQAPSLGLYLTDLLGKLPRDTREQLREALAGGDSSAVRAWLASQRGSRSFHYDEWDHRVRDYRRRWCCLSEVEIEGDGGDFFGSALSRRRDLIDAIRREFRMMRPEQFRKVRGMQHGDDFDLNAVIDAHADRRSRKNPSERLYLARRREERDVASLFLIDMSASTDEPLVQAEAISGGTTVPRRRVIDVTKETLALMTCVLDDIGDAYAVYGFSGHGRTNVEYYRIKSFSETLSVDVKSRIGGIEPKRSTRMGAALRHAGTKLAAVNAKARHLILLSDGFPQDYDYGDDRTSNVYGLRDTMVALQELESQGVHTFCITIDPAGHDYLREMCPESRYTVIDDVADLPVELPKIYRTITRL